MMRKKKINKKKKKQRKTNENGRDLVTVFGTNGSRRGDGDDGSTV